MAGLHHGAISNFNSSIGNPERSRGVTPRGIIYRGSPERSRGTPRGNRKRTIKYRKRKSLPTNFIFLPSTPSQSPESPDLDIERVRSSVTPHRACPAYLDFRAFIWYTFPSFRQDSRLELYPSPSKFINKGSTVKNPGRNFLKGKRSKQVGSKP